MIAHNASEEDKEAHRKAMDWLKDIHKPAEPKPTTDDAPIPPG